MLFELRLTSINVVLKGPRCPQGRQVCSRMGAFTLQWVSLQWPRIEVRCNVYKRFSWKIVCCSHLSEHYLPLAWFQGLCRETLRCPLMAPLSQPLHCRRASPQGDRCILGWVHISRTTPWVATDSREPNMAPKVCTCGLTLSNLMRDLYFLFENSDMILWKNFWMPCRNGTFGPWALNYEGFPLNLLPICKVSYNVHFSWDKRMSYISPPNRNTRI